MYIHRAYIRTYIHTCMHAYMYVFMHTCMYSYIPECIYVDDFILSSLSCLDITKSNIKTARACKIFCWVQTRDYETRLNALSKPSCVVDIALDCSLNKSEAFHITATVFMQYLITFFVATVLMTMVRLIKTVPSLRNRCLSLMTSHISFLRRIQPTRSLINDSGLLIVLYLAISYVDHNSRYVRVLISAQLRTDREIDIKTHNIRYTNNFVAIPASSGFAFMRQFYVRLRPVLEVVTSSSNLQLVSKQDCGRSNIIKYDLNRWR